MPRPPNSLIWLSTISKAILSRRTPFTMQDLPSAIPIWWWMMVCASQTVVRMVRSAAPGTSARMAWSALVASASQTVVQTVRFAALGTSAKMAWSVLVASASQTVVGMAIHHAPSILLPLASVTSGVQGQTFHPSPSWRSKSKTNSGELYSVVDCVDSTICMR